MLKNVCKYAEVALPLALCWGGIYQVINGTRWFLFVAILFFVESIIYVLALFRKTLKVASLIQFLFTPLAMLVLLLSILFSELVKEPLPFILAVSGGLVIEGLIALAYFFGLKKNGDATSYAKFYNALCFLLYLVNLLSAFVCAATILDAPSKKFLSIPIAVSAVSSIAAVYFSIVFLISAFRRKALPIKEKFTAIKSFFTKYELSFVFREVYCAIVIVYAFFNVQVNRFYILLGIFYSVIFVVKLITFLWNKLLEKKEKDPLLLSRKKHWILLFNSVFFLAAGNLLAISSVALSAIKASTNLPAWFFIGFMYPFSIMGFILCMIHRSAAKRTDNAYYEARVDQSLITSLFSFLAGIAYFFKYFSNSNSANLVWVLLWIVVLLVITAALVLSFVHAILGIRGKRKKQIQAHPVDADRF